MKLMSSGITIVAIAAPSRSRSRSNTHGQHFMISFRNFYFYCPTFSATLNKLPQLGRCRCRRRRTIPMPSYRRRHDGCDCVAAVTLSTSIGREPNNLMKNEFNSMHAKQWKEIVWLQTHTMTNSMRFECEQMWQIMPDSIRLAQH